jgi:hypothetical protein
MNLLRGLKFQGLAAASWLLLSLPGFALATGTGVFNTGVDAAGRVLPGGTLGDSHFSLIVAPPGVDTRLKVWSAVSGFPVAPAGPWLADNTSSRWIGLNTMYSSGPPLTPFDPGTYIFRTTFDLTGSQPSTAVLSGKWAADNAGSIVLNGASTGQSNNSGAAFFALTDFSLTRGFVTGVNTLDFYVTNTYLPGAGPYNPIGLRVEFTQLSAAVVPELPAYQMMIAVSLCLAGVVARRRRHPV